MAVPTPRPDPPIRRRRPPRFATPILLVLALLAGVTGVFAWLGSSGEPPPRRAAPPGFDVPELDVRPGTVVPHQAVPGSADTGWMGRVADKTDIPERMLRAYVAAETETLIRTPDCRLTWATLAAIGRTESSHGRFRGAVIGPDGRLSPPVIGIPLDGSPGVRAIRDTDGGRLDGDVQWDRAVGAMQFLPVTWSRWSARANGDGATPDPQNVDDAALSAARYLCASGGDLGSPNGWWRAVLTYNRSNAYGRTVFSAADAYARAATA
ncbi:MAG TPA: murein transglycosylase [Actinophytocola sp.]|uniref:lytic transglycosylase domain-containing protein n=1 Tax=Actinophytocola sp. TaxID=1872138 RepID=UPI002DBAF593|nr:murein transglycosylase [Actinophytocola sp.]HEU5469976.1 murein transglycosylase [Actinophytocola sp.]